MLKKEDILSPLQTLQLQNKTICFHSSFKSFGTVEGGPETIIQAFLEANCSLLVPTFTYACQVSPPNGKGYLQNGVSRDELCVHKDPVNFDQKEKFISKKMGVLSRIILEQPSSRRGDHPLNSFASIGSAGHRLIDEQSYLNVYGPYKQLYKEEKGVIVLAGVDLTSCTPVHFAEEKAGRKLFRNWAKDEKGNTVEVEVGSCSNGFESLRGNLKNIERRIKVGRSQWRVYPFNEFIDQLAKAISENPDSTHCDNKNCRRCHDAVKGGPILESY